MENNKISFFYVLYCTLINHGLLTNQSMCRVLSSLQIYIYYYFFPSLVSLVWLHQTRIGLSLYDVAGQGYLKESVSYIVICELPCLKIITI